jgi:peptidyl-prolyl cis-trans isomerase D
LKVGDVSPPVKSESGYHLIKLVDQQTKEKPTFEEKKAELAKRLQQGGAQPELVKAVEHLRDLVFNSDGLKGPAEQLKLSLHESDWLDRKTRDPLLSNAKVVSAAFSSEVLKDHNNSDVIELAPDHYLVLRIKDHEAATPEPLETVKPAIVSKLKQERANEEGQKAAQQLLAQVRQGEDLQKLAAQSGYSVQNIEKSARNNGEVPAELLRAVFAMPRPTEQQLSLNTISLGNGDVALLQLQGVTEGTSEGLNPIQRNGLVAQLRQSFGTAAFAAYVESVRGRADIKRH